MSKPNAHYDHKNKIRFTAELHNSCVSFTHVYRNEQDFDYSSTLRFGLDPGCLPPLSGLSIAAEDEPPTLTPLVFCSSSPLVAMADAGGRRSASGGRRAPGIRRVWCCSFAAVLQSPDRRCRSSSQGDLRTHKPSPKPSHQWYLHSSPLSQQQARPRHHRPPSAHLSR